MNAAALLSLVQANQPIALELLDSFNNAVKDDQVRADVFAVVDGSQSVLAFAERHPRVVARLAGPLVDHPELAAQFLAAIEGT